MDVTTAACPQCGSPNPPEANFCAICGFEIDRDTPEQTAVHPVIRIDEDEAPFLVVIHGNNSGSRFVLDEAVTSIGRHPESSVFLDDVTGSRRHAEVTRVGDTFTIRDAGSLNGTYVNGKRVEQHELAEGDNIQVGKYRLVLAFGVADALD